MSMPDKLTEAEQHLISAAGMGVIHDFSVGDAETDKLANAANWGPERTIRAEVIRALCLGRGITPPVDPKGIHIRGARIVGPLDLGYANIPFPLGFNACYFEHKIYLLSADIVSINLNGAYLADGMWAEGLSVKGNVLLRNGFIACSEILFTGGDIGGQLDCSGGHFHNPKGTAFEASGLTVKGPVYLGDGFIARGKVNFIAVQIGNDLNCSGGSFENQKGFSINIAGATVKGSVLLQNGFNAKGQVVLNGAIVGINLSCTGATFDNLEGMAFSADGLQIKGLVLLNEGFIARGEVRLNGADIGGQLTCTGGHFENFSGTALNLDSVKVAATAFLTRVKICGVLNLRGAQISELADDKQSWPDQGKLLLDQFKYDSIVVNASTDAKSRLKWLSLQPTNSKDYGFRPQPYEQLVKVLRAMGHESDARKIAIAKQQEMRKTLGPVARAWSWILRISTGYGYETWRAFIGMALMVAIGTAVFSFANGSGDMVATSDGAYVPIFNAFIYSLDAFLPIVDLHQETYWLPQSEPFKWYLWFHISAGWILSTISVAAFTGLFKDE
ncbi:MAG: hypothetical protein ACOY15_10425 [Pseudomonadota bacterium]